MAQSFATKTKSEANNAIWICQSAMCLLELICSFSSISFQGFKFLPRSGRSVMAALALHVLAKLTGIFFCVFVWVKSWLGLLETIILLQGPNYSSNSVL
jgi:hypothetical protein